MSTAKEITVRYFVIDPKDIVYLKAVLESYEGMVVVRTVEAGQPVIELLIASDFMETIHAVIQELQKEIKLEECSAPPQHSPWVF